MESSNDRKIDILIVEDEIQVGQYTKTVLEKEGYTVTLTRFGEEAIKIVRESRPRLILLDLLLADLNGIAVLREIRKFDKDIVVFITTAYPDAVSELDKYTLDVYTELDKPVSVNKLREYVQQAMMINKKG